MTVMLAVISVLLAAVLAAISVFDLRHFRIPDALSLPLVAAGLGLAWAVPMLAGNQPVFADHLIGAAGGFLVMAAVGEGYFRLRGFEGLGLGDAKLFAAAGAWLGWQSLPLVLLIAALGGLAYALVQRRNAGAALAFGPWISLAFFGCWLWQLYQMPA